MSLLKSAATVGGFTMISRLLGFLRDQLIAFTLGTGFVAEAFFVAQRFPNLFRALFAEGAFNSAFVPLFAKKAEGDGNAAALVFARDVFSVMLAWLIFFSALAMIFMPAVIYVIANRFVGDPKLFALTIDLTRICFPYLLLMSLTALQGGVLNSLSRFTAAAAAPILLNLVMISANGVAWWYGTGNSPATGYIFAWGIFVAGLAQFALLSFTCRRVGMPILPGLPKLTPDVKRLIWLTGPGIVSGGIIQINLLIATIIATGFPGAVAYLYYADRLYQLPLGIIGAAIGVVLLPDLSRKLRANDQQGLSNSQNRALEMSLYLTVPAAVALMAIPMPIVRTVFEHGAFHRGDTAAVAPAVAAFAASLPAFSMTKVFQPGFYAREDTRTPMVFAMISVAVNIIASLVLSRWIGHVGIALATSIAAWVNAAGLGVTLAKRGHFVPDDRLRKRLPATLSAAFAMGLLLLGLQWLLRSNYVDGAGFQAALLGLIALVGCGGVSFFLFGHFLGAMTFKEFMSLVRR